VGHKTNIVVISTGIVRNLLKTPYYLRIPEESAVYKEHASRTGRTIKIPATEDVELDYRSWKLVEDDLIIQDNLKILKIIRYPAYAAPSPALIVINNYYDLPASPAPGTIVWVQYGDYQGIYYYDETRGEWLSENETTLTWSSSTDSTAQFLNLVSGSDDTRPDNDYQPKTPITITGITASQANTLEVGNATRFEISTYSLATGTTVSNVVTLDLTTVGERGISKTDINVPINDETIISANRTKLSGDLPIKRPAMTAWYRERLVP
jgi:hypothetical protein